MMLEYARVLLQYLWKNIALLFVFNLIVFQLMATNDGLEILSNDDDQLMPILMLFAIESFVYAMWLQWSPNQRNLWQQLTTSEPHLQGLHFSLFFAVSLSTQLLPLLIYMALQSDPLVYVTLLDYTGAVYVWCMSLLAYGAGMMVSWWRKWSLLILLLLTPFFFDLMFTNLLSQIIALAMIALLMISFVFFKEQQRNLIISVTLSFAVYEMLVIFTQGILLSRENIYDLHEEIIAEVDASQHSKVISRNHIHLVGFRTTPSLIDDRSGHVDWLTKQYQIPEVLISDLRIKQKLESGITTLWAQHTFQTPVLELINKGQLALFFHDAVYVSRANGTWQNIWQGKANDALTWYQLEGDTMAHDYTYGELFSDTKLLLLGVGNEVLVFNGFGNFELAQTLDLNSIPLAANIQQIVSDEGQHYRLAFLNADNEFRLYESKTDVTNFTLTQQKHINEDLKTLLWGLSISEKSMLSASLTQIRWATWRAYYPDEVFGVTPWFMLSQLGALLTCLLWFKQDNRSVLVQKSVLVAVFSWPLLITLMYCMPRQCSQISEKTNQLAFSQ